MHDMETEASSVLKALQSSMTDEKEFTKNTRSFLQLLAQAETFAYDQQHQLTIAEKSLYESVVDIDNPNPRLVAAATQIQIGTKAVQDLGKKWMEMKHDVYQDLDKDETEREKRWIFNQVNRFSQSLQFLEDVREPVMKAIDELKDLQDEEDND